MIKGLIFNQAFWIKRTNDVANKLNNYDKLQSQLDYANDQLDSLNGEYRLEAYNALEILTIKNGKLYFQEPASGDNRLLELKKGQTVNIDLNRY